MPLAAGTCLGPYEILAPIGAGGMGEVYKARDSRLNRFVAIKILPAERLGDADRKQRFIREARAASALNHPNIVAIYDIAVSEGRDYIVMEYVGGKTLDALIPRAGMRLAQFLKIAVPAAEGLSVAHAAGIIHRDLKPSNIMVSETGVVKILDFGLAKLTERDEVTEDAATRTLQPATDPGTVMGTAAYMSPEQAEGKPVDGRSDIFSFGAVLYEMATGRRAFAGDSQAATMSAVLNKEPLPPRELAPELPAEMDRVIMRCMRKDPGKRQQHMTDVKVLLEELREESDSGKLAQAATAQSRTRSWAAAGVIVIAAAGAAWWFSHGREAPPPRVVPLTTFTGSESLPSFSPDGNQVVFTWDGEKQDNTDLYVTMIGSGNVLRLTTDPASDSYPAWSPDGRQIAFVKRGQRKGIYLISPLGGTEQRLIDIDTGFAPPAWSADGKFLVVAKNYSEQQIAADAGSLLLVPIQGGESRSLLIPPEGRSYWDPTISPDGRSLAFASCAGSSRGLTRWNCEIQIAGLNADLRPHDKLQRLAEGVQSPSGIAWTQDGRSLVYGAQTGSVTYLFRVDLAEKGEPKRLEIASRSASRPALARTGNRLAFSRNVTDFDVWRLEAGGQPQRFLVSTAYDGSAQFSTDGQRIVFQSSRGGDEVRLWVANADGTGPVPLTSPEENGGSAAWSPDGRWIAFDSRSKDGYWGIKVVDSNGGPSRLLAGGSFNNTVPRWSHDGKGIYFGSDRSGRSEIWRTPAQGGAAEQVTHEGGFVAQESPDGRTLYFTKTVADSPLFARSLAGGGEKQVVETVSNRAFVVFEDGIYYLSVGQESEIRFHEFATGHSRTVSVLQRRPLLYLSVSPDRKTFLFTMTSSSGTDLMLIENFR